MKSVRVENIITLILVGIISVLAISGAMCLVADAGENIKKSKEEAILEENESRYIKEVREILSEQGFSYSGVNVTKITEDEKVDYTVSIYNRSLCYCDEAKLINIENEIKLIDTSFTTGDFNIIFQNK